MRTCNRYFKEEIYGRTLSRLGGSDNISVLFVSPGHLPEGATQEGFILGGCIRRRQG